MHVSAPLWLSPLNHALNRALAHAGLSDADRASILDTTALVKIQELPDFLLHITPSAWQIQLPQRDLTSWPLPESIDLLIETDLASLKSIIYTGHVPPGKLKMSGDMATAQALQQLLKQADINWGGLLADHIGDIPAQVMSDYAREILTTGQRIGQDKAESIVEYLLHEKRLLVDQNEWQALRADTQALSHQVERAIARCQQLRQQLDDSRQIASGIPSGKST